MRFFNSVLATAVVASTTASLLACSSSSSISAGNQIDVNPISVSAHSNGDKHEFVAFLRDMPSTWELMSTFDPNAPHEVDYEDSSSSSSSSSSKVDEPAAAKFIPITSDIMPVSINRPSARLTLHRIAAAAKPSSESIDESLSPVAGSFHECYHCLNNVSYHLVNATFQWAKAKCENSTSSSSSSGCHQRMCEWIHDFPQIVKGYIDGKLRATQDGFFYCAGKGICPIHPQEHHNHSSSDELPIPSSWIEPTAADAPKPHHQGSAVGLAKLVESAMKHHRHGDKHHPHRDQHHKPKDESDDDDDKLVKLSDDSADDESSEMSDSSSDWNMVKSFMKQGESIVESTGRYGANGAGQLDHKGNHRCVKCYIHQVERQLCHSIKKVKKFCESKATECPFVKASCEWARHHHEYTLGYIFAVTSPSKYAAGYCTGKGKCEHHHSQKMKHWVHFPFKGELNQANNDEDDDNKESEVKDLPISLKPIDDSDSELHFQVARIEPIQDDKVDQESSQATEAATVAPLDEPFNRIAAIARIFGWHF